MNDMRTVLIDVLISLINTQHTNDYNIILKINFKYNLIL